MSATTLMQPDCLQAYAALMEEYLTRERDLFQQKYKHFPPETQQIMKNYDIEVYTIRTNSQAYPPDETHSEEEVNDENLRRRIEQYNRNAKPSKSRDKDKSRRNRRNEETDEGKPKRKVRTTITPAKLEEMNRIFKQYLENQEKNRDFITEDINFSADSDRLQEYSSLKLIGERLGLGYSTILHKFREYRATRKVKGGALIASINQKRKYKKSREIEELIENSLKENTFYTAVELSKYIFDKYNKVLSRSIISRHLGEMGYSYKNIKTNRPINKNTIQIKQTRRTYAAVFQLLRIKSQVQVYYLDEQVFWFDQTTKTLISQFWEGSTFEINLTIIASSQGILRYQLRRRGMTQPQFLSFIREGMAEVVRAEPKVVTVLVMDMDNPLHMCQALMEERSRLRLQKSMKIFFLPPHSHQMNMLDWFYAQVRKNLGSRTYSSFQDFRNTVEEVIGEYRGTYMESFQSEAIACVNRGMAMENLN